MSRCIIIGYLLIVIVVTVERVKNIRIKKDCAEARGLVVGKSVRVGFYV